MQIKENMVVCVGGGLFIQTKSTHIKEAEYNAIKNQARSYEPEAFSSIYAAFKKKKIFLNRSLEFIWK